jgi:NDP-4-keto-2,6-dideoxyhexose 3-C-methyltransferase
MPTHFIVLPWHFRAEILPRETEFRAQGGRFIFPLPELEVV